MLWNLLNAVMSNDLKKTWGRLFIIRSIANMGERTSRSAHWKSTGPKIKDAETLANKFINYFANIAQSFTEKMSTSPVAFKKIWNFLTNSFGPNLTSSEEIIYLSHTIRTTHSKGVDDINPYN